MQTCLKTILICFAVIGLPVYGVLYFLDHGVGPPWSATPAYDVLPASVQLPACTPRQQQALALIPPLQAQANVIDTQINNLNVQYIEDIKSNWQGNTRDKSIYDSQIQTLDDQYNVFSQQIQTITNQNNCNDT